MKKNNAASETKPLVNKTHTSWLRDHRPAIQGALTVLSVLPPLGRGTGLTFLALWQVLSAAYSLRLLEADPVVLSEIKILAPLLTLPLVLALSKTGLSIYSNKKFIYGEIELPGDNPKQLSSQDNLLKVIFIKRPTETAAVIFVAGMEGMVIYMSEKLLITQFDLRSVEKDHLLYVTLFIPILASIQTVLSHAPRVAQLLRQGWEVEPYTKPQYSRLRQFLSRMAVNLPPLLSVMVSSVLVLPLVYQLMQLAAKSVGDSDEMASRIGWVLTPLFITLHAFTRLALRGRAHKRFLAHKIRYLNENGLASFLKENCRPGWKSPGEGTVKLLMRLLGFPLLLAVVQCLGYSAWNKLFYIVFHGVLPPVPLPPLDEHPVSSLMPLRFVLFNLLAFPLVIEALGTDVKRWQQLLQWTEDTDDEQDLIKDFKKAQKQISGEDQNIDQKITYFLTFKQLISKVIIAGCFSSTKIMFDIFYMPNTPANELTWKHNLMTASIEGSAMALCYVVAEFAQRQTELEQMLQSIQIQQDREINADDEIHETLQSFALVPATQPLSKKQLGIITALFGTTAIGIIFGTQLLMRYALLKDTEKDEDIQALDNSRAFAAVAGAMFGAFGGWSLTKKIVTKISEWHDDSVSHVSENVSSYLNSGSTFFKKAGDVLYNCGSRFTFFSPGTKKSAGSIIIEANDNDIFQRPDHVPH